MHAYMPDFILRLKTEPLAHLILETKGYDPREELKSAATQRWLDVVNAEGSYGTWAYSLVRKATDVPEAITRAAAAGKIKPGDPVAGIDVMRSAEMSRDAFRRSEFLPRGFCFSLGVASAHPTQAVHASNDQKSPSQAPRSFFRASTNARDRT
jgi:hypothetical protein